MVWCCSVGMGRISRAPVVNSIRCRVESVILRYCGTVHSPCSDKRSTSSPAAGPTSFTSSACVATVIGVLRGLRSGSPVGGSVGVEYRGDVEGEPGQEDRGSRRAAAEDTMRDVGRVTQGQHGDRLVERVDDPVFGDARGGIV